MSWRLLTGDGVSAARGLATDEVLAALSPPTLRLYTYRPHVALVGRFQDPAEIHLDWCERHDIQVNRRPTGGGAILMGPDQLGVALALPGRQADLGRRPRELMGRFAAGLVRGLRGLGIAAVFRGRNDLAVDGSKIAGLGVYRDPSGGLLFHASLLVDLDLDLMSRVLKTPFKRVAEAEPGILHRRIATVRKLLGRDIDLEEVRSQVAAGFVDAFDVRLEAGELEAREREAIDELEQEKYRTRAWVFQQTEVADSTGSATLDTPAGLLDVRVALAGRMIKAVSIRGDFFADENAIADLEARLRWHSSEPAAVAATVRKCAPLEKESLVEAILSAAAGGAQA
jgi:lipoate---protein ligase